MSEALKRVRCNDVQKNYLVDFMFTHRDLGLGTLTSPFGVARQNREWAKLAEELAKLGPRKSVEQWKTTWRDLKSRAKTTNAERAIALEKEEYDPTILAKTELYDKILAVIGRTTSEGLPGIPESRISVVRPNSPLLQLQGEVVDVEIEEVNMTPESSQQSMPHVSRPFRVVASKATASHPSFGCLYGYTNKEHFAVIKDGGREPIPKKLRQDNFTIVKRCCVNLVKKHGRSVTLFDDLAFRELIDLIPMTQSEKQTLTSQYIQSLLDDDQLADVKKHGRSVTLFDDLAFSELIDLIPMTQSEKQTLTSQYIQSLLDDDQLADKTIEKTTVVVATEETSDDTVDDDNDENPVQELKCKIEPIVCTCGKDTDEKRTRHTVECPASSQQPYWNFFDVFVDKATCSICNETSNWTNLSSLKEHLQNSHPSVDFGDDDEKFRRGPASEDGSTNDLEMEEVYLDETVLESEQTASAAKRRRKKAKAALKITGPITRENIAASLQRFKSLDSFGQYVASLMKLIPKDKCIKFQIQFVEQLLQEQAAAG